MSNFRKSSAPQRKAKAVQFSIMSPEDIVKIISFFFFFFFFFFSPLLFLSQREMSVCEIDKHHTFEQGTFDQPVRGGLVDPRLGTTDRGRRCETCEGSYLDCAGHFGHINLVKPVFHIGYFRWTVKVIRCVCYKCGKLLVDKASSSFGLFSVVETLLEPSFP